MGMTRRVSTQAFGSTASQAVYLHWLSHYLQSPLTALTGYIEMIGDRTFTGKQTEMVAQARAGAQRAQQVLNSIVALHRQLERGSTNDEVVSIDSLLNRVARVLNVEFAVERTRSLPSVCLGEETAFDGICLLLDALRLELGSRKFHVTYRQRSSELVIHIGIKKRKQMLADILKALSLLPTDHYPLIPGEYIGLATGVVLLRASGCAMVVRPASARCIDMYLHVRLLRQLSLVDITPDLG